MAKVPLATWLLLAVALLQPAAATSGVNATVQSSFELVLALIQPIIHLITVPAGVHLQLKQEEWDRCLGEACGCGHVPRSCFAWLVMDCRRACMQLQSQSPVRGRGGMDALLLRTSLGRQTVGY